MRISDWSSDVCSSDLTTSLGFAEFLALMTPFALHLVTCARRFWVRMAAACYLPVLFWAILLTDSRLGVVGYCLSFLSYLFIHRSEEHTSELQSLMRISYAVFCLKQKNINIINSHITYSFF